MDAELLKKFIGISREEDRLKQALKQIQEDKRRYEPLLREQFAQDGIQNVRAHGCTAYLTRSLWASAKDGDYERLCKALAETGHGELVKETVNLHTLSALIREFDRLNEPLPPPLEDAVKISEVFEVRVRQ